MVKKNTYSFWVGLWKSVKNNLYILISSGAVYFGANATQILSDEWAKVAAVVASVIVYMVKNKIEFTKK